MAGKDRNKNTNVDPLLRLTEDPWHFGFFQALRLIECAFPEAPGLGKSQRPADDPVRLGQEPSLRFAPATLSAFERQSGGKRKLQENFFGLFGPNGPLPLHLTEYARHRMRHARDSAMVEFMDMFHHRLISLFYRSWADSEPAAQYDRPDQDRFAFYVDSLVGLGEPSFHNRDAMPDYAKRFHAGNLANHTGHVEGLTSLLTSFFGVPAEIEEFVGEWLELPQDNYCYLNQDDQTGQLGQSATLGVSSWQCQHRFRIRFGPVGLEDYQRFLPGEEKLQALTAVVRNYVGLQFVWELNLLLTNSEVPAVRLGRQGQLGWTSWMGTRNTDSHADDLCLEVGARLTQPRGDKPSGDTTGIMQ